jgi:uncharacterized protein YukE
MGDPDQLDALATRIAAEAETIRDRAGLLRRHAAEVHWRSAGADAFRDRIARDVAALNGAAAGFDDAATALRHHADTVRGRIRFLQEAAERARAIAGGVVDAAGNVVDAAGNVVEDAAGAVEHAAGNVAHAVDPRNWHL